MVDISILYPKSLPCLWISQQEHDEPILKHLKDIQVKFSEPGQPMVSMCVVPAWIDIIPN